MHSDLVTLCGWGKVGRIENNCESSVLGDRVNDGNTDDKKQINYLLRDGKIAGDFSIFCLEDNTLFFVPMSQIIL